MKELLVVLMTGAWLHLIVCAISPRVTVVGYKKAKWIALIVSALVLAYDYWLGFGGIGR